MGALQESSLQMGAAVRFVTKNALSAHFRRIIVHNVRPIGRNDPPCVPVKRDFTSLKIEMTMGMVSAVHAPRKLKKTKRKIPVVYPPQKETF